MRLLALALVSAGAVMGCGGGGGDTSTSTSSRSRPPPAETRTHTSTTPTATIPTVPRTTTTTSPEQQPGGAGDEQAPRVPAQFILRDGRLQPPLIQVPATFPIAVSIRNADSVRRTMTFGANAEGVPVAPGVILRFRLPGLRKGKAIVFRIDGKPAGRIASGLQPGP